MANLGGSRALEWAWQKLLRQMDYRTNKNIKISKKDSKVCDSFVQLKSVRVGVATWVYKLAQSLWLIRTD